MSQAANQEIVDMLTKVLEEAKRGEISSAVLLTMNGTDGHVGYWARITSVEDYQAAPGHMEVLKDQLAQWSQTP
jgi:hypothetical protein